MCETLDNVALADTIGEAIRALREVDAPDQLVRVQAARRRAREFDAGLTGRRVATLLHGLVDTPARPGYVGTTGR